MKTEVDLVDVAGGNLGSVRRCLGRLGVPYKLVNPQNAPDGSRPIILPGVGNFGAVMQNLQKDGFDQLVRGLVAQGTPYLGICVGMQILFDWGEESDSAGLGLLPGRVVKFKRGKIPQIGWNRIEFNRGSASADSDSAKKAWPDGYVYFVNSFVAQPENGNDVLYSSDYFGNFCAAVKRDNICGFQFHPEKSGPFGQSLLVNWIETVCANNSFDLACAAQGADNAD
ncbi:MAG: imidazole glycerol phosphate synthase subunit HisH [Candidatus Obscuribacterales bacterium]|nr:imidazole glycerol phosphate synthase subunit HisH [Candidatus Obscuribacterales bacterium]